MPANPAEPVELLLFGAWATFEDRRALDALSVIADAPLDGKSFLDDDWYLVSGRCSTGCHVLRQLIHEDSLDRLETFEGMARRAFTRAHSEAVGG